MATREEWQRLINTDHELALVQDDLLTLASDTTTYDAAQAAQRILFERF